MTTPNPEDKEIEIKKLSEKLRLQTITVEEWRRLVNLTFLDKFTKSQPRDNA